MLRLWSWYRFGVCLYVWSNVLERLITVYARGTCGVLPPPSNGCMIVLIITLRAIASCGAVYCNRSCLHVYMWLCNHDNSKLRSSIFTKLGLQLIKFWPSRAPGKGSVAGRKILAPPYYSQRAVCVSSERFFH